MKARKTLTLSEFRGVDFSSSPLRVNGRRAADMVNFYQDDGGVTRKRPGWCERTRIVDASGDALPINGVFQYEYGERHEVIVHAGARFFRLAKTDGREAPEDITESGRHVPSRVVAEKLTSTRSQVFYAGRRMYIIGCGDYLVYGTWDEGKHFELRRVAFGEDTYIPQTTISIGGGAEDRRETLDMVNLLTPMRINLLQGVPEPEVTDAPEPYRTNGCYKLDASVDEDGPFEITNMLTGEPYDIILRECAGRTDVWLEALGVTVDDGCYSIEGLGGDGYRHSIGTLWKQKGVLELYGGSFPGDNKYNKANPTDTGDCLIEVKFKHTATAEEAGLAEKDFVPYEERVARCAFGVLYGANGNTDQLFLSGNPRFENVDFYSWDDDMTYFPDEYTTSIGLPGQAVVGYGRLSDNTLAIFKERKGGDASIFYRKGNYVTETDDLGFKRVEIAFPTTAGNAGEAMISRYASLDFGGDFLMLSGNGVFGIEITDNVKTEDRYTRDRSPTIRGRLCAEKELSDAVAIAYKNRYYLAVSGHCYVADARFRFYADKNMEDSYSYEWWYWDNVPARVWAEINGRLFFGTKDGRLCAFDEQFSDRTFTEIAPGEIAIDAENSQIDCAGALGLAEGDTVIIDTPGLYALLGQGYTVRGGRIYTDEESILSLSDGVEVYADGEGLPVGTPYILDDVDVGDCSFRLLTVGGAEVMPSGDGFRLHRHLSGRALYVADVVDGDFRLKPYKGGAVLQLSAYDGEVPSMPTGCIIHKRPVAAIWVTPTFDLGSAAHGKTLLSVSMTAEPGVYSRMSYGYETRSEICEHDLRGSRVFSFDSLDYRDFSFDTGFARSDTRRVFTRGFNYISFRFCSEGDTDCAIGSFSAIYKIDGYQGGVR